MYIAAAVVIGFSAWQLYRFQKGGDETEQKYSELSAVMHTQESEIQTEPEEETGGGAGAVPSDVRSGEEISAAGGGEETEETGGSAGTAPSDVRSGAKISAAEGGEETEDVAASIQQAYGQQSLASVQPPPASGQQSPTSAQQPSVPETQLALNTSILTLQSKNEDTVGWITVPGTVIDYPVMQTPDDPEYYLHHDFEKNSDIHGTPFLDAGCRIDGNGSTGTASGTGGTGPASGTGGTDPASGTGSTGPASGTDSTGTASGTGSTGQASGTGSRGLASGTGSTDPASGTTGSTVPSNLIIYGHHMKDGTMFADLMKYRDASFCDSNPTIELTTLTGQTDFRIFAVLVMSEEDRKDFPYYRYFNFQDQSTWDSFISGCQKYGIWLSDELPEYGSKLVTLSTCEYSTEDGRLVVIGAEE